MTAVSRCRPRLPSGPVCVTERTCWRMQSCVSLLQTATSRKAANPIASLCTVLLRGYCMSRLQACANQRIPGRRYDPDCGRPCEGNPVICPSLRNETGNELHDLSTHKRIPWTLIRNTMKLNLSGEFQYSRIQPDASITLNYPAQQSPGQIASPMIG